ncbi:MAG TPA: GGDEF domain-containing protein [Vicinamibacteria bacterium]|nr:GGDEF domain-containing protein [Vicinamibacteria bacterium]
MESCPSPFIPFFLGLAITSGLLIPILLRLRSSVGEARAEKLVAGERYSQLKRGHAALEEDLRFLNQFMKDYPRLARELYSGLTERQIPGVLLGIVQRSLDPQQVAVLVRRSDGKGERARAPRLVVAAAYPEGAAVALGTEVALETGEIGFAAEAQIDVSRQDLSAETTVARVKPGPGLPGMPQPDLIAPLVFDQETLGVIVVAKPRKSGELKAALRLVAQTGAQVLHTAAQVSRMKLTAEMDGLTRVFNKKHLEQALNEVVYRAACSAYDQRSSGDAKPAPALSVFLFDIDHFKNYNDSNGHLAGDKLLQELARLVNESVRKDDVFGRFGGEEFLLVMPHTNATQAMAAAEKIRNLIATHPFPFGEKQPMQRLSISGGVAEYPRHGLDAAALLHAADEALYVAKRSGRNQVVAANGTPPAPAADPNGARVGSVGTP